ncbi:MAG: DNA replication/repair protein RecF, partial [Chlamydiota bacterium]
PLTNLIQGDNGQGKTNLLEAIHLLSTGRSFRASALADLIGFQQSYFYVEGHFEKDGVDQKIKIYYDENTRRVQYNETVHSSLTSLLGILPSVLLCPDDLSLISGTPSERRRFLDMHIAQYDPLYLYHLGRYYKGMKQRNALLKAKSEVSIDAWEHMMAQSASYLVLKREESVVRLKENASRWLQILSSQQDAIQIEYDSSLSYSQKQQDLPAHFMQIWKKNRPREMLLGTTAVGPHRDDIEILIGDKPAKLFSSEGQKRSCTASLRFSQWELMQQATCYPPLLGIDDFGIQLDSMRLSLLQTHLSGFQQVFLTSPHPFDPSLSLEKVPQMIRVEKGAIASIQTSS